MRFLATLLLWLVTTAALAVAVPAVWAQSTLISEDGYASLATSAARDSRLQDAMASELTTQVIALLSRTAGISILNLVLGLPIPGT